MTNLSRRLGMDEEKKKNVNQDEDDMAFYETLGDWDVDEDINFESLKIFDDTERRSTEITIHHDVAQQLQAMGCEEVHLTFIPDVVPTNMNEIKNVPPAKTFKLPVLWQILQQGDLLGQAS